MLVPVVVLVGVAVGRRVSVGRAVPVGVGVKVFVEVEATLDEIVSITVAVETGGVKVQALSMTTDNMSVRIFMNSKNPRSLYASGNSVFLHAPNVGVSRPLSTAKRVGWTQCWADVLREYAQYCVYQSSDTQIVRLVSCDQLQ
jgi:hypothetical protein